jgi:Ser/Thr protein kinase RdoA (MazF antagonist)/GNAT superfamily N-acetyltransferase
MMSLRNMVQGVENDAPAKQLIQFWEHDAESLKFWRASSNFIYVFERSGDPHFLRFIHQEDNSFENIQTELDFMLYLIDNGYSTVAPIRSKNGHWIETVSSDNGVYYAVVFEQAKGAYISLDQMSDSHFEHWGKSLASLHHLSEAYTGAAPSKSWTDRLAFISMVLQRYPQDVRLLQELNLIWEQFNELPAGKGYTGLIHYDFETDNIFYVEEEARYCAIDFDDMMVHWFMMDVISAISDLTEQDNEEASRKIQLFVAGYRSIKPLDETYVGLLPVFQKFSDLYILARLLRSVEHMNIAGSPEWAIRLKDKLLGVCAQIRGRYRPAVTLEPIDQKNWYACTGLEVTDEQKNMFPVPTVYWLAESAYSDFVPLALYTGEQLIGFAVYAVDPDDGSYWIMAYMIDHKFQHRGLGRSGMKALIHYIKEKHCCDKLLLGHRHDNEQASHLYASLGFEEIDRNDREVIRELKFPI